MTKHFCGGEVIYNLEECFFWCRCCCKKFVSLEQVEDDNVIAEQSDEQYEYEEGEVKKQ